MMTKIKQPKSAAGLKKHKYSISPRMPQGQKYDPNLCGWIVVDERSKTNWQCSRPNGKGNDQLWCPTHATRV